MRARRQCSAVNYTGPRLFWARIASPFSGPDRLASNNTWTCAPNKRAATPTPSFLVLNGPVKCLGLRQAFLPRSRRVKWAWDCQKSLVWCERVREHSSFLFQSFMFDARARLDLASKYSYGEPADRKQETKCCCVRPGEGLLPSQHGAKISP